MQNLMRSKTIGVTGNGGRGTAGAGPGRDHRSGLLIQKRALESDICRHYTGHDTFNFMASVQTLKEVHEVCRLQVDPLSTFEWGTDC